MVFLSISIWPPDAFGDCAKTLLHSGSLFLMIFQGNLGKLGGVFLGAKMTQDRRFPRGSWIQVELQSEILKEIRRPKVRKITRFGTCVADFFEDLGSK